MADLLVSRHRGVVIRPPAEVRQEEPEVNHFQFFEKFLDVVLVLLLCCAVEVLASINDEVALRGFGDLHHSLDLGHVVVLRVDAELQVLVLYQKEAVLLAPLLVQILDFEVSSIVRTLDFYAPAVPVAVYFEAIGRASEPRVPFVNPEASLDCLAVGFKCLLVLRESHVLRFYPVFEGGNSIRVYPGEEAAYEFLHAGETFPLVHSSEIGCC